MFSSSLPLYKKQKTCTPSSNPVPSLQSVTLLALVCSHSIVVLSVPHSHIKLPLPPSPNFLCLGVFHSGVEVLGREYCFGGHEFEFTGVFVVSPRIGPPGVLFKWVSGFVRWQDLGVKDGCEDMLVRVRRKRSDRDWIGGGVRKVSEAFRVRDG